MHEGEGPQENEDGDVENVFAYEHKPDFPRNSWPGQPAEGIDARVESDQHECYQLESSHNTL